MKGCIPFILYLLLLPWLSTAGVLKGKITDSSGEELPFATVFIQGTTIGTSANAQGEYRLTISPGTHRVACQYIGYKQSNFTVTITADEVMEHDFRLDDQSLEMKEHVVKATEDPGVYIMRKVIERRAFHQNQIKAFQTGIYLKGTFRSRQAPNKVLGQKVDATEMGLDTTGKGILYLCEEIATYYKQNEKERTVIHSVRESGTPNGLGFSTFPEVISFYDNNIQIADEINPRGFISPANDLALNFYKFKLEGDFNDGKNTIYKIKATPKRQYEPLFTGYIYIVDEEWAIHSLNMLVTKRSNMELIDTLRIEQVYLPLRNDTWVIKQQVLYPTMKILGFDFTGYFVTVYNNQKVNQPAPDSIFNEKIISVYEQSSNKKDTSFWTEARPVPLEADEHKDYIVKDSLRLRYEDPAYKDSVRRRGNRIGLMDVVLSGITHTGKDEKYIFRTNSLLTGLANYNTIEGVSIAPKIFWRYNLDTFHALSGAVGLRYGFENTHFNAIGRVGYTERSREWRGRSWTVGIEVGKYVFQFNPNNPIEGLYNTIGTLFYRKNYTKIYERGNAAAFFGRNYGTGLRWNAQFAFQKRIPISNTTDFSFAKPEVGGFTENIPTEFKTMLWEEHNATLLRVTVAYQPGFTYTQYPDYLEAHGSEAPVFTIQYEKGIPNLFSSKVDFDKWRVSMRDNLGLRLLGSLSYNVVASGFLNTSYVSIPDLNHLNGNQLLLASPYLESFQLAPYYTYSNKEPLYGELHLEWKLKGFLTNKIPLLRQLRWYLVTGANGFYANDGLYHVEAFAGIDNLGYEKMRFLRLDVVQGWNSFNQRMTGIRIGITQDGLLRVNLSDTNGEW